MDPAYLLVANSILLIIATAVLTYFFLKDMLKNKK
jgi:hypothetical protein